ncbi:MAG: SWIM zinc finger family protein [Candidatus Omnitrophica bacterium]|nr:SWIM zinc finger family protein [Candidatus Omnitrophota bacterium]
MFPIYDLNKIKFSTDTATFQRGVDLYGKGKVVEAEEAFDSYSAIVQGTKPYRVSVSGRRYKDAHCTCSLGERGTLCKHVVALALHAVMGGQPLKEEDKQQTSEVKCGGKREALDKDELTAIKKSITESMRYIKPYHGPSRIWFANQDSLQEGCNRLSAIISDLPVNKQTAEVLVKVLLRLEKKLIVGGVDDSNGIVGGFMSDVVQMVLKYVQIDPECVKAFKAIAGIGITSFGWEEPLVRLYDERVS